ncbi:MAG: hypothetical protein JWQ17_5842 [Tardiphaga sp.]|jgi:hypothetical protein|nr:hypothetical protein [Tardiphaga sp.]
MGFTMNIPAAIIAVGIGAVFFALEVAFPYRPDVPQVDLAEVLSSDHSRARAAVARLLHNPNSAQFSGLLSVDARADKFVCGAVSSKDKSGSYVGPRAFVYTASLDFARIDDDGQIAAVHAPYRPCPLPDAEKPAQKPAASSPAMTLARKALDTLPQGSGDMRQDLSVMQQATSEANISAKTGSPSLRAVGQIAALATPSPVGSSAGSAGSTSEGASQGEPPVHAWPTFAPDDPLAKPASQRTNAEAIALASDVEQRWSNAEAGRSKSKPPPAKPSSAEIREALRALLAIDPKSPEFPKAWALFGRLRQIDREATAMR